MNVLVADPIVLTGYQLRLPSFEGPLDVLLRLIEREQLAITDVSLVAVTDQFLGYLATLEATPAGLVAEFVAVGGRLVLLKSRSLLPRPPAVVEEPDADDLVRQLVEYRALRAASDHLALRDRGAAGAFPRGEGVVVPAAPPPRLAAHQAAALARALRRRLTNAANPKTVVETGPIITLREMTERLLLSLLGGHLTFGTFRRRCAGRPEVLVAFLSLLLLVRRRLVEVRQDELFGEITISRAGPAEVGFAPSAASFGAAADD